MSNAFLSSSIRQNDPQSNASTVIGRLWDERERAYAAKLIAYEQEEAFELRGDQTSPDYVQAVRAADAACDAVEDIDDAIMDAPVAELADLVIKARIVHDGFQPDGDRVARLCSDIQMLAARKGGGAA